MKTSIAPFLLKNDLLFCKASGHGNLSELSAKHFLGENSDKGVSGQYLRPNIHPIYQVALIESLNPDWRDLSEEWQGA